MGEIKTEKPLFSKRELQQRVRRVEEKYRGVIENMDLGLIEVNLHGRIVRVYDRFCQMSGYRSEELVGKNAVDVFLPPESLETLEQEQKSRLDDASGVYEARIRHKDGHLVWVLISGSPVFDASGNICGSIGIHYDISAQKELQKNLETARKQADEARQAEKMFLANMSHEIRTPLNAIIGMAHLLQEDLPTSERTEYTGMLKNSAEYLLELVSDVLHISKIKSGLFQPRPRVFVLREVLEKLRSEFALQADRKGLLFKYKVDEDVPVRLVGDKLLLHQILSNLLSNAFKFTSEGEIGLEVTVVSKEIPAADSKAVENETGNHLGLRFTVFDTGCGIPSDQHDRIFESFRQTDRIHDRKKGTGLGLAIVKELTELQKGSISLKSATGRGSRFSFTLPYSAVLSTSATREADENEDAKHSRGVLGTVKNADLLQGQNILVVEDNPVNIRYVSALLDRWGARYEVATDGKQALDKAAKKSFDLILMDIGLPGIDGFEVSRRLRSSKGFNASVNIIALTATTLEVNDLRLKEAGIENVLTKPFTPEGLLDMVTGQLNISVRDAHPHSIEWLGGLDAEKLSSYYGDDEDYAADMFETFLKSSLPQFDEMREHFRKGRQTEIARIAHKLAPACSLVGLSALHDQLKELEQETERHTPAENVHHRLMETEALLAAGLPIVRRQLAGFTKIADA